MILALDVGNTNIEIGCMDEKDIRFTERFSTDLRKTDLEYAMLIKTIMEIHGAAQKDIEGTIISSVVPPLTHVLKVALKKLMDTQPLVVGAGIKTGLNIRMDNPASIGADLIVGSVAAIDSYGAPLTIIDMGTATTMAVIDKDGVYSGGVIMPGVNMALEALSAQTAQLPLVSLGAPKKYIGKNTDDAMKSGIIYGEAAMLDGMIDRFEEELGYQTKHVATGGLSRVIIPHCRHEITMDPHLILKGLRLIYDKNR